MVMGIPRGCKWKVPVLISQLPMSDGVISAAFCWSKQATRSDLKGEEVIPSLEGRSDNLTMQRGMGTRGAHLLKQSAHFTPSVQSWGNCVPATAFPPQRMGTLDKWAQPRGLDSAWGRN